MPILSLIDAYISKNYHKERTNPRAEPRNLVYQFSAN